VRSLGTATTRRPAARAARTPRGVSSTATHSAGSRPSAAAAARYASEPASPPRILARDHRVEQRVEVGGAQQHGRLGAR
jgi:hypothetical protein